jgi:hypothetical protein
MESTQCPVCVEDYTSKLRREIKCEICSYSCCIQCTKQYVKNTLTPHCMNCKHHWDKERQYSLFGQNFVNNEYRITKKELLFEQEKAKIPSTQNEVERVLAIEKTKDELKDLFAQVKELKNKISRKNTELWNLEHRKVDNNQTEQLMKCPGDECMGYINGNTCKICHCKICRKCISILPSSDADTDTNEHVCDENQLKTAQLIMKETKPCPSCGTRISKINGCDQMWCTNCNQAFSWSNNKTIHGIIHNPHYFEWLTNNGEQNQFRVPGDVVCGGLTRIISSNIIPSSYRRKICVELRQNIYHIQAVRIDYLRQILNDNDLNREHRVNYILKRVSEEQFKKRIMNSDNKLEKARALLFIYEMFVTVATERWNNFFHNQTNKEESHCKHLLNEIVKLAKYANEHILEVSIKYTGLVYYSLISERYHV